MTSVKRLSLAVLAACFLLAGCGDDGSSSTEPTVPESSVDHTMDDSGTKWYSEIVETPYGPVECVVGLFYLEGGISCNWDKYNATEGESNDG